MSETSVIALYREITGASEAQAKNAYMFMEIRDRLAAKAGVPSVVNPPRNPEITRNANPSEKPQNSKRT